MHVCVAVGHRGAIERMAGKREMCSASTSSTAPLQEGFVYGS